MAETTCQACHGSPELLRRVEVRPIQPDERGAWDALVAAHHYLGLRSLFGKTLRYVATLDGRWLALLGWQAAALKCAPRDTWIGWGRVLHYQRLHLLANNARFLILPAAGDMPNLASRVLALNLRRLSADWQRVHGHPLLLAETFVDRARFTGACYRAANWQVVGTTRGFARRNGRYAPHGAPKQALVYPLHPHARALLCAATLPAPWSTPMQSVALTSAQLQDLQQRLSALPNGRRPRGLRHRQGTVLSIAIAAVLAGRRGYSAIAEWAADLTQAQLKRLRARFNPRTERFEPPSEPTLRRVLQTCDAPAVNATLSGWLLGVTNPDDAVAVDGKALRGALRPDGTQVHLLSAFLQEQGITIAQREISGLVPTRSQSSNPSSNPWISPDGWLPPMPCIPNAKPPASWSRTNRPYLLTVKANQPTLYADLSALTAAHFPPQHRDPR